MGNSWYTDMSIEAGVVIGYGGGVLHWHLPPGRSAGYLPDTGNQESLWYVLWDNRDKIFGFAHSHPGSGEPAPSWEDLTTFAAVEKGLGKRLVWPIVTSDRVAFFVWSGPGEHDYQHGGSHTGNELEWLSGLRIRSNF